MGVLPVRTRAVFPIVLALMAVVSAVVPSTAKAAAPPGQATAEVQNALNVFLTAFDNLDWPAFRDCFAPDATVFHPASPNIKRIDSPQDFERTWLDVFARIKKTSGRDSPPYMNLSPRDLKIELLSEDVALVTFHLVDGTILSRRTIILKRGNGGWRVVHIHASNLAMRAP